MATGIMVRQYLDILKARVDSILKKKVPTKEFSLKANSVVKGDLTTSMAPGMKDCGKILK